MVLHVKDEETDRLVRQLAAKWRLSITDTIRRAAEECLEKHDSRPSLWDRTADLRAKYANGPDISTKKAFFDSLSEDAIEKRSEP